MESIAKRGLPCARSKSLRRFLNLLELATCFLFKKGASFSTKSTSCRFAKCFFFKKGILTKRSTFREFSPRVSISVLLRRPTTGQREQECTERERSDCEMKLGFNDRAAATSTRDCSQRGSFHTWPLSKRAEWSTYNGPGLGLGGRGVESHDRRLQVVNNSHTACMCVCMAEYIYKAKRLVD